MLENQKERLIKLRSMCKRGFRDKLTLSDWKFCYKMLELYPKEYEDLEKSIFKENTSNCL